MKIYTIGHSNRSMQEFLQLIQKHNIATIVDVRRFPTSKIGIYRKENMEKWLKEAGIEYIHLEKLGGYRGGYGEWMKNNEWKESYELLKKIASERRTAIMCAEKLPFRCHRRFIAMKLRADGWKVIHIIDDEKTWEENKSIEI